MAKKKLSFEESLAKLEEIAEQIERGDIGLEESITKYEEGMNLVKQCRDVLEKAELRIQKIQEKMVQRSSNVTRLIDKLQEKGLVNREECASNRRKMDITITLQGLDLLEKLDEKVKDFHVPMTNNLTTEEAQTLKQLIIKLKGQ